jgi:hypothetical protein
MRRRTTTLIAYCQKSAVQKKDRHRLHLPEAPRLVVGLQYQKRAKEKRGGSSERRKSATVKRPGRLPGRMLG